jgi:hypothetical protein
LQCAASFVDSRRLIKRQRQLPKSSGSNIDARAFESANPAAIVVPPTIAEQEQEESKSLLESALSSILMPMRAVDYHPECGRCRRVHSRPECPDHIDELHQDQRVRYEVQPSARDPGQSEAVAVQVL